MKTKGMEAFEEYKKRVIPPTKNVKAFTKFKEYENTIQQELKEASELNKTPTTDEVCAEIAKYYKNTSLSHLQDLEVRYNKKYEMFSLYLDKKNNDLNGRTLVSFNRFNNINNVVITEPMLPPHLLELIAKFYKGVVDKSAKTY